MAAFLPILTCRPSRVTVNILPTYTVYLSSTTANFFDPWGKIQGSVVLTLQKGEAFP